jgi:hypothetical protein
MAHRSSVSGLVASSASPVVNAPEGIAAGDLILICLAASTSGTWVDTLPAGFELYGEQFLNSYDSGWVVLLWKIAGSSEPSTYSIVLGAAAEVAYTVAAVSGVTNPTTPIASASFQTSDQSTPPFSVPSATVTPPFVGADLVLFAGFDTFIGIHSTVYSAPTSPGGMTQRTSISGANAGATSAQNMGMATGTNTATAISGGQITNPVGSGAQVFAWALALNASAADSQAPSLSAGPTISNANASGFDIGGTADENCTASLVVTLVGADQPDDAAFDASTETAAVTAGTPFSIHHYG